jgi:hypothetical protein
MLADASVVLTVGQRTTNDPAPVVRSAMVFMSGEFNRRVLRMPLLCLQLVSATRKGPAPAAVLFISGELL